MNKTNETREPSLAARRSALRYALGVEIKTPTAQELAAIPADALAPLPAGQSPVDAAGQKAAAPSTSAGSQPAPAPDAPAQAAKSPVIDFWVSDATLDRAGEVIVASGWRLEHYRRNPVFQNAHNYGDILFTLGRALVTEVREGRLYQRVLFATDINPMAKLAYDMYRHGFLKAVSVGFAPLRWENGTPQTPWRRRYVEQELLEVSAVAVPANPNALALALKSGAVEKSDLCALQDLLRGLLSLRTAQPPHPAAPASAASASAFAGSAPWAGLLQLAHNVASAIRQT